METRQTTNEEQKVMEYLNDLRDSGVTNMHGAAPFIEDHFDIDIKESRRILSLWMKNFNEECNYKQVKI